MNRKAFIGALLLSTTLMFAGCGRNDNNNGTLNTKNVRSYNTDHNRTNLTDRARRGYSTFESRYDVNKNDILNRNGRYNKLGVNNTDGYDGLGTNGTGRTGRYHGLGTDGTYDGNNGILGGLFGLGDGMGTRDGNNYGTNGNGNGYRYGTSGFTDGYTGNYGGTTGLGGTYRSQSAGVAQGISSQLQTRFNRYGINDAKVLVLGDTVVLGSKSGAFHKGGTVGTKSISGVNTGRTGTVSGGHATGSVMNSYGTTGAFNMTTLQNQLGTGVRILTVTHPDALAAIDRVNRNLSTYSTRNADKISSDVRTILKHAKPASTSTTIGTTTGTHTGAVSGNR